VAPPEVRGGDSGRGSGPRRVLIDPLKGPPNLSAIRWAARDLAAHQGRLLAAAAAALDLTPGELILQRIQERERSRQMVTEGNRTGRPNPKAIAATAVAARLARQVSFDIPIHPNGPTEADFQVCADRYAQGVLRRERERRRAALPWWLRWLGRR
jgi:hypothetical protein